MKKISCGVLVVLALAISIAGCRRVIIYQPELSLGESPSSIKARAKIEEFIDESPPGDKRKRFMWTSATEPDSLASSLAVGVTNAVLADFNANGVFEVVGEKIADPDFIIRGKIHRFYGKRGLSPIGTMALFIPVPIGNLFWAFGGLHLYGFPGTMEEGEIHMEISIYNSDDLLLGTYSAQSSFNNKWLTMYSHRHAIGRRLNESFNEVISNIRSQILAEAGKLQSIRKASSSGGR